MKIKNTLVALVAPFLMNAQNVLTPETLWTLNKIGVTVVSPDHNSLIYSLGKTDLKTEKNNKKNYFFNIFICNFIFCIKFKFYLIQKTV